MSRTFYRMRTNLPSRGATDFVVPRWLARMSEYGPGASGDYTGLITYSVISW